MDQKKKEPISYQEGAGSLLLMAAAQETGLLTALQAALGSSPECDLVGKSQEALVPFKEGMGEPAATEEAMEHPAASQGDWLGNAAKERHPESFAVSSQEKPRRPQPSRGKLGATLLFLGAVGVHRTWDLRSYSGDALGLLIGRKHAYSYSHTEQFLSALAKTDAADRLTDALLRWTSQLWHLESDKEYYVDGHHKPVYSHHLIPRGLIGRTHQILGCRGLMLLHDSQGHPLLVLTGRGDWHVMDGLVSLVERLEHVSGQRLERRIVVDREGMGAAFLKERADEGHSIVTLLRSNQYQGLSSFEEVGTFVPLTSDPHGLITRQVAPARFALALPEPTGAMLQVEVALIRDLRACRRTDSDRENGGQMSPRLIPIITTDPGPLDAVSLAQSYLQRWAAQENVIKDYLLPLGLDSNHGFCKAPVVNSEVAKKREAHQKQLETLKKWKKSSQAKHQKAIISKKRLLERIKRDDHQYSLLSDQQALLDVNSIGYEKKQIQIQKRMDILCIQQEKRGKRLQKLSQQIIAYQEKGHFYARKQGDLLGSLEHLAKNERSMYELDNRKDHIMTVFKVALANLAMWTRDQYFPDTYAHATWKRLASFFCLPGIIRSSQHTISVSLRPFNDRQYNRDLHLLCQRVNQKQLHLPDGRLLTFSVLPSACPILNGHTLLVA
jgi:hypothetical protein